MWCGGTTCCCIELGLVVVARSFQLNLRKSAHVLNQLICEFWIDSKGFANAGWRMRGGAESPLRLAHHRESYALEGWILAI